jgi:hypothetical protein
MTLLKIYERSARTSPSFPVRNKKELRDRLLLRSAELDFSRLAKDLEPFVYWLIR